MKSISLKKFLLVVVLAGLFFLIYKNLSKNDIVGTYKWNNDTVEITDDGLIVGNGYIGKWFVVNNDTKKYIFVWNEGQYIDIVNLINQDNILDGVSLFNNKVHGQRVNN